MKPGLRLLAPVVASLCLLGSSGAQLRSPGRPLSSTAPLPADVPFVVLPAPDLASLRAEDEAALAASELAPWRYGAALPVDLGLDTHGRWDEADGKLVWRLELRSPGAYSLGVFFDAYELPPSSQLFLYDPAREDVLGAYDGATGNAAGALQIQPLRGDAAVLEYVQDASDPAWPRLHISQVIHDYRDVFGRLGASTLAANCLTDVNCPQGANYQDVKRSVLELLINGSNCSGALLNNRLEDGTPYMLTANHCGSMVTAVFVFNFELSGCGSGTSSQAQTLSGATLLAANGSFDSQLYLLNETPPQAYTPFYAGWYRGSPPLTGPSVGISHPAGLEKKITTDDEAAIKSRNFWVVDWEDGELLGGSSGSPLFDGAKRVVGPACCVSTFTCGVQQANYGRFSGFWNNEPIAQYLDPQGVGGTGLDGYDPFAPSATVYNGSGLNPSVLTSTTPPALGTTWTVAVDASAYPAATVTYLQGRMGSSAGTLFPFGELLIDLGSPFVFASIAPVSTGLSTHSFALPGNQSFGGLVIYVQAGILGITPAVATNGLRVKVY
jgi:lysyl endopeptidase